jgi:Thiamine pyrophosphate-requiring enzymes [acetolactate synthase, pyruvate dehydrogenase (cytochrome), glyoxylate carboligase, phosphonopyruvate decarboxylase]
VRPNEKVLSISGDGGFLFSAMELETAVRLKSNFVHMIWIDGTYDMVRVQEIIKYGRGSGVELGPYDPVLYAKAFGAPGPIDQERGRPRAGAKESVQYAGSGDRRRARRLSRQP